MSGYVVGFLDRSREIRDHCYFNLRKELCTAGPGLAFKFPLSVLVLNRHIWEEARQVLYRGNPFTMVVKEDFSCRSHRIGRSPDCKSGGFVVALKQSATRPLVKNFVLSVDLVRNANW